MHPILNIDRKKFIRSFVNTTPGPDSSIENSLKKKSFDKILNQGRVCKHLFLARRFFNVTYFHPSLIFEGRTLALLIGAPTDIIYANRPVWSPLVAPDRP